MTTIKGYDEAIAFLVSEVPDFAGHLADLQEFYGDDLGAHIVVGDFSRYVERLFRADRRANADELRACFGVVEAFASSDDDRVKELAGVSFLEIIGGDPALAREMLPWWGPNSQALFEAVEEFWARMGQPPAAGGKD